MTEPRPFASRAPALHAPYRPRACLRKWKLGSLSAGGLREDASGAWRLRAEGIVVVRRLALVATLRKGRAVGEGEQELTSCA